MKKLINEEVKRLQKIAGLKEEEDFGEDDEMFGYSPLTPEDIKAVEAFIPKNYPEAQRDPSLEEFFGKEKDGQGQQMHMYYRWNDPSDTYGDDEEEEYGSKEEWDLFRIIGIVFAKDESGNLAYWEFTGNGETSDPYSEPSGYVTPSGDKLNAPMNK
jgi:hypothetical protein